MTDGHLETSTNFPSFWRSPLPSSSSHFQNMPGSTDQVTAAEEHLVENVHSSGVSEHRIHNYVNRPEGEMDMMIGFFLMNGVCIFFFLLFGLCVIFSCLRKGPNFNFMKRRKQFTNDIEQAPLNQEEHVIVKPKFKSIVSQVIKTNKVTTTVSSENEIETVEMDNTSSSGHMVEQVRVHASSRSPSPQYSTSNQKSSIVIDSRKQSMENSRRCSTSISQENSAMIRHNLLGPLSFDDLYYM